MSYSLQSFDLATLDTLLYSQAVDPVALLINDYLIEAGDTKGLSDTTSLISVQSGTPPFPTSQPAQVDFITTPGTYSIDTDQYPGLQAIILDNIWRPLKSYRHGQLQCAGCGWRRWQHHHVAGQRQRPG